MNQMNENNVKQTKGLNRNTIDKYYTKKTVVDFCIENVKKYIEINNIQDLIIEPSAGNGSFIAGIKSLSQNFIFYDLEPENDEIIQQDYLLLSYNDMRNKFNKIHAIGNPPFGRQSSLAINFIKKSCQFCDSLSFILPKSFKKDSLKNKFPENFHIVFEYDLPNKSFLVDGKEHDVPCIFQIWEKRAENRENKLKLEPINFKFVNKTEQHDISFRRVGGTAGTIDKNTTKKSIQSHYFIKLKNNSETIINALKNVTFETNNTVGPKSISKPELIAKYNTILHD